MLSADTQLHDTQRAFDSVAAAYDGALGNNTLVQHMRSALWRALLERVPRGGRLLDLGCGTGIDAAYFASQDYSVVATDWSPQMVARARARAASAALSKRMQVRQLGVQDLAQLDAPPFDAVYSNLGPLNCAPDLRALAVACAGLLKKDGVLVASVMGRICPWEFVYYAARGNWGRATVRSRREVVPVPLNQHTVWTRYYTPGEFYRHFTERFALEQQRALNLFLPPPYLINFYERSPRLGALLAWLDERFATLPFARAMGDHFLMVLRKRA